MNAELIDIPVTTLLYSIALLILGSFLATLHLAFQRAGDAGIARLTQKFPNMERYSFWISRWEVMNSTLMIVWTLLALSAIILWFRVWLPSEESWNPAGIAFTGIPALFAFIFALRVIPVILSESYADRLTLTFLPLAIVLSIPLYILARPLSLLEQRMLSLLITGSDDIDRPSSEDEILQLVEQASEGELEEEERQLLRSVFEFGETVSREIMTPRVDIEGLEFTDSISACANKVKNGTFSRYPVFSGSQDDVRGIVHVRELLKCVVDNLGDKPVSTLCNKITFVPESMPINELFRLLRSERSHMAMVVDEYGGTAGLVTMEDIIEELVGEIHDEFDAAETRIQRLSDHSVLLDARIPVHEVNELIEVNIPETDDYDSVAGYIFHKLGRIPRPGEIIKDNEFEITVHTASTHRIHTVRVIKKFHEYTD